MIFTAFYTKDSPYEDLAADLRMSLDGLSLTHDIRAIPPCSWKEAVMQTGDHVRRVRHDYPGEAVCQLDADAIVMRRPILFDVLAGYDVALHWLKRSKPECLNGTVVFWPTAAADAVVEKWCFLNDTDPSHKCADQVNLGRAIADVAANVYDLPPEYCWLDTISAMIYPNHKAAPVIWHKQASREYRHKERGHA